MRHPPPVARTLAAGSNRSLGTRLYRLRNASNASIRANYCPGAPQLMQRRTLSSRRRPSARDPQRIVFLLPSSSSTARCGERQRWRISRLSLIHVDSLIDDCTRRFLTRLVIWDISESEDSLLAGDRTTSCRPVGLGRWGSVGSLRLQEFVMTIEARVDRG